MMQSMVHVVVARWNGRLASALREAGRMTEKGFAEYLGISPRVVASWEARPELIPVRLTQETLDTALARADDQQKARFIGLATGNTVVVVADSAAYVIEEAGTDRRYVLKTGATAGLAALVPLDALERITRATGYPIDAQFVADHERFADALAGLHLIMRPDVLVNAVTAQADRVFGLLDQPMPTALRRRVDVIAVELHAQAASLAFAAGDRALARRYFALAQSVAGDSGNDTLRAQTWGASSILYSAVPYGGRGGNTERAVDLLSQAVDYARSADIAARAWIHRWLAVELAVAHDERGFFEHIAYADQLGVPSNRGRGYFARGGFDVTNADAHLGAGLALLGHGDEAMEPLGRAAIMASPRRQVNVLVNAALARVAQREPEQACADLTQAYEQSLDFGYGSGVERVHGVRAQLLPEWTPLACVRQLDERLRTR
jgi:hypothetical protein